MFKNIKVYSEYYNELGIKTIIIDGILFREYQKMIIPVGPVKFNYQIYKEQERFLFKFFKNSLLVRLNYDFDKTTNQNWYSVICDMFLNLDTLSSNTRSKVKRGLKNCQIEKINSKFLLNHGYEVYLSAFKRYKDSKPIKKNEYLKNMEVSTKYENIIDYWGVFEKKTGKLIAYSQNFIYDNIEVNYSTIKFHPDYLFLYPSYSLFFEMNKYYLEEKRFEYVNDGFKSILHETNIQSFLIEKFGFRKAYTNLYIEYKPIISFLIKALFPINNTVGLFNSKLKALFELEKIKKNRG